ncbi:ornithine carbamoyltransferase [Mesobacillus selenatarsenatis]|uniref:Ornithine carbamoyltransferase n=1 Tax=Mesobacillus selenatarsenatis (strain DSM 18680 / JCM 14380 / FERM P-15431 / SF-1) TaxID=1321606 RepID=A0A0A8X6V4_MESS1|nr:ornithine carbamoyltransferase [Mesobacillus selenatarsenatis]GAM15705.1 ornithine carbamoyltransferase [Mesobacillus selenatarsenatis SF-1]
MTALQQLNIDIKGKDLLTLADLEPQEILTLLERAVVLKEKTLKKQFDKPLKGKILGMIFDKSSTRTRVSFEVGMIQLGGSSLYLNGNDLQLGRGESVADTAQVLSQYLDGIMIRTFSHKSIEELADHADIPVINGLTDLYHPCQALADLQTISEKKGKLKGLKLAYIGDGNNVAHSLMIACTKVGMDVCIASPKGYFPDQTITARCEEFAKQSGANLVITESPQEAVDSADIIYTDVWTSMGQELENEQRLNDFYEYQVNEALLKAAKEDYLFMHCLPAHRGEEVTAEVIDGQHSVVFEQAGNRLHAQKALLVEILKD